MILIVGLGNPGTKYENTRHNVGFMVTEKIAKIREAVFRLEPIYKSRFADTGCIEHRVKIVQPQTFMNESGESIAKIKNFYKIESVDIWVIYDDVDLELGKIRVSFNGSSAGHKGIQSIIDKIGEEFWRVRIGIGKNVKVPTEKWVLQNFNPAQQVIIARAIDKTADLIIKSLSRDLKEETIKVDKDK